MIIKTEYYTDENGIERKKEYYGKDENHIAGIIDSEANPIIVDDEYIPTDTELIQAEILLNQVDILAKQNEQDEVLAEILLNQMGV